MGVIMCPIHGGQVIGFTSPALWKKMLDNEKVDVSEITKITAVVFGTPATYTIDKKYLEAHHLEGVDSFVFDEDNEDHVNFIDNLKAVCPKCFSKFIEGS